MASKSSSKRIDGKGIQRRGKEAAGILRKWMPFFKAATNGTGERASGDTTWAKVDLDTLGRIWEWQLVTKHNDKVKRAALKKDQKKDVKADGEAEEDEDEEDEDEAGPIQAVPADTPVGWRPELWSIWQMDEPTSSGGCHKLLEVKVGPSKRAREECAPLSLSNSTVLPHARA